MNNVHGSKIKIFSLGGIGETGRNLYIVEVDQAIFILDAGIKNPGDDLLGVDAVIPDIKYLVDHKEQIVGLFLTQGHEEHIGAVPNLLKDIKVPVYGSKLTMALVEDSMQEAGMDLSQYQLIKVRSNQVLSFGALKVSFFSTTLSIPDSLGIAIHTPDGVIVYTGNFTFDQNVEKNYQTDYRALTDLGRKGVLAILSESLSADKMGHTLGEGRFTYEIEEIFSSTTGRIIVSVYSTDLKRIQKIIDVTHQANRKVAIIGRKLQRIVDLAVKMGYLQFPSPNMLMNLKYIDEQNTNNYPDLVVLATGERDEPFDALIRMTKKLDRLINIEPTDTIIVATPAIQGVEIKAARTIDLLHRTGANVHVISKEYLPLSHASSEDIKLMINLLQPKYIIPVIGEYRHLYAHRKLALGMGYEDDQIILLENGVVAHFEQGELVNITKEMTIDEILVDGLSVGEINDVVLKDRHQLSQDGIVLPIVTLDYKTKKIIAGPEIVSRGFIYVKENEEIIQTLINIIEETFSEGTTNPRTYDMSKVKNELRDKISKYLYKETKRKPIIMLVVNEI